MRVARKDAGGGRAKAPSHGVGTELIAELWSPDAAALGDVKFIRRLMLRAARASGSTVVSSFFHHAGGGVSGSRC